MSKDFIHTSESVTEGHPDKLCDQISDAIVDRFLEHDFRSRVTAECAVSQSVVFISARFASKAKVDFNNVARKVLRKVGYSGGDFDYRTCNILTSLKEMAPEDLGEFDEESMEGPLRSIPVKQQVTLFGFACNHTSEFMPLPIQLAHALCRRLAEVKSLGMLPYLAPDGTTQVAVSFSNGRPTRIHSLAVNTSQIDRDFPAQSKLRGDIIEAVITHVFKDYEVRPDNETLIFVNPGGPLMLGGPSVHSGLTGRKNAIDTYGGFSRNSGSALSGKDPLRIDRVGAYAARHAAKNVVAAGLAERCEVQLTYSIGLTEPTGLQVETIGTGKLPDEEIAQLLQANLDFTLSGIIRRFNLRKLPQIARGGFFRRLAAYGHFGRPDLDLPWENLQISEKLRG
jgi:S-adenosylmethionine synthetase